MAEGRHLNCKIDLGIKWHSTWLIGDIDQICVELMKDVKLMSLQLM